MEAIGPMHSGRFDGPLRFNSAFSPELVGVSEAQA